jgi:hypothetical protein
MNPPARAGRPARGPRATHLCNVPHVRSSSCDGRCPTWGISHACVATLRGASLPTRDRSAFTRFARCPRRSALRKRAPPPTRWLHDAKSLPGASSQMEMLIFPCDGRCTMQNIANLPEPISAQSPPAVEPISARSPSPRDLHLRAISISARTECGTARGHARVCPVASPTRRVADPPPLSRPRISKACMPVRHGSEASDPYPLDSPDRTAGKRSDRARACAGVEAEPVEGRHAAG